MELKGIDVSKHNGVIDWKKIKNSGIDFAIIRTGYGKVNNAKQRDEQFENNYRGAKAEGIKLGAYHYSYALTVEDALMEADFVLDMLNGKQFEFPIYFDIEDKSQMNLTKKQCTEITDAFCKKLEKENYWVGVYSFDSFFSTHFDIDIQDRYTIWVARVENIKPTSCKKYDIWQYSHKGSVTGSSVETDLNIGYKDFEPIIKKFKKNGFVESVKVYSVKFTGISTKGETDTIVKIIGDMGYKDHVIEEK